MGWGTQFKADIYLSRQRYSSKAEVQCEIEDNEQMLKEQKERLLMYASATPKDVLVGEGEPTMYDLWLEVSELIDSHTSLAIQTYKLELLLENFDTIEKD